MVFVRSGVSRVTARTVRRHRHKFSADLVLHGIRKSTFPKYWNFNVLEMAFKTLYFVPGLSRTPLLFILRYLTNLFFQNYFQDKWKSEIENLKVRKSDSGTHIFSSPEAAWSVCQRRLRAGDPQTLPYTVLGEWYPHFFA